MSSKIWKVIATIIVILVIILEVLYIIDMKRMKDNMPVIFSTWGKEYAAPLIEYNKKNEIEEGENNRGNDAFYGKVIESRQNYIIVEPNEGEEIRKSADRIYISLGENNDAIYQEGINVKITYTGYIMETYPAQVNAVKIELKSAENFEIKVYDKHPQTNEKIHKILDKTETETYNYNIYVYECSVNILIDGKEMSLRNALLENKITMEEIITKANKDLNDKKITGDMYKDGGSIIYKYETYTIIKKHTIDGNRDVYIGIPEMTMQDV